MKPDTFPRFLVDETTLVFAFRYALGRKSTAPSHMALLLKRRWNRLAPWTHTQIHREIAIALDRGDAGDQCDVETWRSILALPAKP